MSLDEFYRELAKQAKKFKVSPILGEIRHKICERCPISMVGQEKVGVSYWNQQYLTCGQAIGLSRSDIIKIVQAADNQVFNKEVADVRKKMLHVLNLEEI